MGVVALALLFSLSGGVVAAHDETMVGGDAMEARQAPVPGAKPGAMGSTTKEHGPGMMKQGSSTEMMRGEGFRGVPGIVTAVGADYFLMTSRGLGKATTTITVKITPTTKFSKNASTTGSLADVIAGAKVEVLGKVATSTKTITAQRVMINPGKGVMKEHVEGKELREGSTTEKMLRPSFLGKFKNFLKRFGSMPPVPPSGGAPNGGPAAVETQHDFLGSILTSVFMWFDK